MVTKFKILILIFSAYSSAVYGQNQTDSITYDTYNFMNWDFRTLPAVGFFPFGGDTLDNVNLATFIGGVSVDLINFNNNRFKERFTLLNISGYLVGLNYSSLSPNSESQFFNISYVRFGPHYRWQSPINKNQGKFAFGAQMGYGILLQGDVSGATSNFQHGLDISVTFTWNPYRVKQKPRLKFVIQPLTAFFITSAATLGIFRLAPEFDSGFLRTTSYVVGTAGALTAVLYLAKANDTQNGRY